MDGYIPYNDLHGQRRGEMAEGHNFFCEAF